MMLIHEPLILGEFLELVVKKMSPEEIIAFKASPEAQARVHDLLDKNNAGTLSGEERIELERSVEFEQSLAVLKANALKTLKQKLST